MFGAVEWAGLGLSLGLYMPTLNDISYTIGNADDHLMQTIQKWLEKKDNVKGTTWQILIDAVESEDRAAAQRIPAILKSHNIVETQDVEKGTESSLSNKVRYTPYTHTDTDTHTHTHTHTHTG